MVAELVNRLGQGDRSALARLLSLAARGQAQAEIAAALPTTTPARVVAFTGSGGVGKSTLIGKLIDKARALGQRVAVLACDPESPLTHGAILGDRFRMGAAADDGVFIRSLATPGGHGAVAEHLPTLIRLLETFGFDLIFVETVGSGQGDVSVRQLAVVVVLLLQPEAGDDIQWEKAGVLEVADVIAVHKADLPGAEQTAAQVQASLALSHAPTPVILVSSKSGNGIDELFQAIRQHSSHRGVAGNNQELLQAVQRLLAQRFASAEQASTPAWRDLLDRCRHGLLTEAEAAAELLRFLTQMQQL